MLEEHICVRAGTFLVRREVLDDSTVTRRVKRPGRVVECALLVLARSGNGGGTRPDGRASRAPLSAPSLDFLYKKEINERHFLVNADPRINHGR